MEFLVKSISPEMQKSECIVIGVFESQKLSSAAKQINKSSCDFLSTFIKRGDIEGKIGQVLFLHDLPNVLSPRVLLVGCGNDEEVSASDYKKIIEKTILTLNDTGTNEATCFLSELNVKEKCNGWTIRQAVEITNNLLYNFNQFKSDKESTKNKIKNITFTVSSKKDQPRAEKALEQGLAISLGANACKDLANMPPNICTPLYLSEQAIELGKSFDNITTEILDTKQLSALKMNSYLAVAQGSVNPAYMSIINYQGGEACEKPIVLIGKGLTFDSGGISIKPSESMDEMKYDMGGAASVFGAMKAIAELNLPINVIGILAGAENMPSSNAYRPGDILTSMSGQTIEVINTDAEGRLVLCDVLTYVEKFQPKCVVDIATLTGACIMALGHNISALVSPNQDLANCLLKASVQASDKAWQLPMDDEYQQQLDSQFADMTNTGGRPAGTITAACFLSRFAKKYDWAHLDVAGTAWRSGANKGATGRPVALLTQFIINQCEEQDLIK